MSHNTKGNIPVRALEGGTEAQTLSVVDGLPTWVDQAALGAVAKATATIDHTALTDAVNGEAQVLNVGAALPAGAIVIAALVTLTTQFTGGGATSVKLDVGGTKTTGLFKQFDVFGKTDGGAVYDQNWNNPTLGHPHGGDYLVPVAMGGQQVVATFTPDGSHALSGLTAGSVKVDIYYVTAF